MPQVQPLNLSVVQHENIGPTTAVDGTAGSSSTYVVLGVNFPAYSSQAPAAAPASAVPAGPLRRF